MEGRRGVHKNNSLQLYTNIPQKRKVELSWLNSSGVHHRLKCTRRALTPAVCTLRRLFLRLVLNKDIQFSYDT